MSIKLGVVMDPIADITYKKDTTLAMLWSAQDRNWSLFYMEPPDLYIDHIWGENEVGGTSVLYLSDVPLMTAGWPADLAAHPVPELAERVLHTLPATFLTVAAGMAGIHWIIKRRQKLAAHPEGSEPDGAADAAGDSEERS